MLIKNARGYGIPADEAPLARNCRMTHHKVDGVDLHFLPQDLSDLAGPSSASRQASLEIWKTQPLAS